MRILLPLLLAGCSTQQRVTLGPAVGVRSGSAGAEVTGQAVAGEGLGFVIGGGGRLVEGLSGGGVHAGLEVSKSPLPWGARGTFTVGPTWIGARDGGSTPVFHARASVAAYFGYVTDEERADRDRVLLGLELFASSIGVRGDRADVLIGLGITVGKWGGPVGPLFAYDRPRN